jgi:hypothetical protein
MAGGELAAVFRGLTKDAIRTAKNLAGSVARIIEKTADAEESNLAAVLKTDAHVADKITAAGKKGAGRPPSLYSRSGALSNREVVEGNVGLPRTPETVAHYAQLAGVDLRGTNVEIIGAADDLAYLDFQGAIARTDGLGVQLGPAAFQDEETLVRTLGHESVHVKQYEDGVVSTSTGPLEDEAYAAEDGFVEKWRNNR